MKKRRVAGMIGGGLALALALFAGLSVADRLAERTDDSAPRDPASRPAAASLTPVSIAQVSELPGPALRLSGTAEAASVVMLLDRGERIRQVRSDESGQWSATLDVPPRPMAIEAVLFEAAPGDGDSAADGAAVSPGIRGAQTVFRVHRPTDREAGLPPLIMVSAPAAPTRIVSSPFGGLPASGPLAMGAIDYDDAGGVIFSGLSTAPGRVRLYVANTQIGETRVGADGRWAYIASSVMPLGEYDVRAELLPSEPAGERGSVSVLFERLPPVAASGSDDEGALSVNFEPFRWQIRRSLVGGGMQSTAIFAPLEEPGEEPGEEPAEAPAQDPITP